MMFSRAPVQTGLAAAVIVVGLLAFSQPARAEEEATALTDGELRRLTFAQLRDGRYLLPLRGNEEAPIRFHYGRGSVKYGDGATEQVRAGLVGDLVAFGDLDGDLVADAAAVVFIDLGGSGTFIHLLAMHDREGTAVQAAREFLGDRVRVHGLAISGGRILVTMRAHRPGDGLCCPSIEVARAFALQGRRLVPAQVTGVPTGSSGPAP